jgi:hypothetical protein
MHCAKYMQSSFSSALKPASGVTAHTQLEERSGIENMLGVYYDPLSFLRQVIKGVLQSE